MSSPIRKVFLSLQCLAPAGPNPTLWGYTEQSNSIFPSCLQCLKLNSTTPSPPRPLRTSLLGHDFKSVCLLPTGQRRVLLLMAKVPRQMAVVWRGPGMVQVPGCSPRHCAAFLLFQLLSLHYTAPNPFSLSDITSPGSRSLKHVCLFPVPCLPHVTSRGSSFQMSPTSISFTPSLLLAHWEGGGLIISCLDDRCSLLAGLLASSLSLLPSILHVLPD